MRIIMEKTLKEKLKGKVYEVTNDLGRELISSGHGYQEGAKPDVRTTKKLKRNSKKGNQSEEE